MIEAKLGEAAARAAERGGKAVKKAKRVREKRPAKRTETVPEFDPETGQEAGVSEAVKSNDAQSLRARLEHGPGRRGSLTDGGFLWEILKIHDFS